jgi:hypothetical protein
VVVVGCWLVVSRGGICTSTVEGPRWGEKGMGRLLRVLGPGEGAGLPRRRVSRVPVKSIWCDEGSHVLRSVIGASIARPGGLRSFPLSRRSLRSPRSPWAFSVASRRAQNIFSTRTCPGTLVRGNVHCGESPLQRVVNSALGVLTFVVHNASTVAYLPMRA